MKRVALLLGLVALPARAQDHAVMGGLDVGMGGAGVSYVRHVEGDYVGFAVGGGLFGVGARVQRRLYEEGEDIGFRTRYLSAGVTALPWRIDPAVPTGALIGAEYGTELVYKPLYFSAALGGGLLFSGPALSGTVLAPTLRFGFGYTY